MIEHKRNWTRGLFVLGVLCSTTAIFGANPKTDSRKKPSDKSTGKDRGEKESDKKVVHPTWSGVGEIKGAGKNNKDDQKKAEKIIDDMRSGRCLKKDSDDIKKNKNEKFDKKGKSVTNNSEKREQEEPQTNQKGKRTITKNYKETLLVDDKTVHQYHLKEVLRTQEVATNPRRRNMKRIEKDCFVFTFENNKGKTFYLSLMYDGRTISKDTVVEILERFIDENNDIRHPKLPTHDLFTPIKKSIKKDEKDEKDKKDKKDEKSSKESKNSKKYLEDPLFDKRLGDSVKYNRISPTGNLEEADSDKNVKLQYSW